MLRSIRSCIRRELHLFFPLLLVGTTAAIAQQEPETLQAATPAFEPARPSIYLGAFAGLGIIHHDALISPRIFVRRSTFPAAASFTSADGLGLTGGLFAEFPLASILSVGARVSYQDRSAPFTQRYLNTTDVRAVDGTPQQATVEGRFETTFPYLNGTPYLKITPFTFPVYALVGPTVLLPIGASYDLSESIVSPAGSVYRDNGKTSRHLAGGDLTAASTVFGATGGIGVDLTLSDRAGLFVEADYSPTFSDVMTVSGGNWSTTAISALVGFRYGLGNRAAAPVAVPPTPRRPRDTTQVAARPDTTIRAGAVTPQGLEDTLTISRRRVRATEVHALLPYVFFDQDSAVIPARYIQLDRRNRTSFQVERISRGNTLNVYYQLLNIIGQRMRDNRRATLTLTGCVGQFENMDTTLARRRAEAIRDYLVNVWRLQAKRITIVPRLLPANASLSEVDTVEGSRENQRVEISSSEYAVVAPVMLPDTSILAPVGTIRFLPPVDSLPGSEYWSLDVMIGDSLVRDAVTGTGPVPRQIDFPIENRADLDLRNPVEVSSTLVIRDTAYADLAHLASQSVLLRQEGRYEEEREVVNGHYLDRYNLLLFSFDSAGVFDFSQQATSIMQSRITPNSIVRVIGHTDRIGLPPYNKNLSQRRAEVAASLLGITPQQVIGMGEKNLLYDNRYPEGRYYCRTVTVEIETPAAMAAATERVKAPLNARRTAAERNE